MFTIIADVHLFDKEQSIYVYEDGHLRKKYMATLNEMPNVLLDIGETYQTNSFVLSGSPVFLKGYQKKIKSAAVAKYGHSNINIEIM